MNKQPNTNVEGGEVIEGEEAKNAEGEKKEGDGGEETKTEKVVNIPELQWSKPEAPIRK